MMTLYTFGDSILDCGHFNPHGVTPGALIVRNNDALFPEFRGRDLSAPAPARLVHRAYDGSTVRDLPVQAKGLTVTEPSIAILTIGGNDLRLGLLLDEGPGIEEFAAALDRFLAELPIRPVFVGNIYDPTFGDDARNFLDIDQALARANFGRMNETIARVAARHGTLVDLHAHFLTGEEPWFYNIIEPSLIGASEVRRCFLDKILGDVDASTPRTGAYYWLPRPDRNGARPAWELITEHGFNVAEGISHRDFWPFVVERLAAVWGKNARALRRRLRDHYAGLPRGRVTHPGSRYLIIHGDDEPVAHGLKLVRQRFQLNQVEATGLFDEHEQMIRDDHRAVQEALGIALGLDRTA
jgi:hypothetical protein